MKVFSLPLAAVLIIAVNTFFFLSCAGLPSPNAESSSIPPVIPEKGMIFEEKSAALPPETALLPPERAELPGYIMGQGIVPEEKLAAFLLYTNARADEDFVLLLAGYYVEEAAAEGVDHDTAFAQMCLETGFLRFGGLVTPDMNNFCGLGAIGPEETGLIFPDPRTGVRAHIQHLQAYASTEPLNQELVDPRYRYVKRGSSPTIYGLAGTWAADRSYDIKIDRILRNLYEFSVEFEDAR